MPCHARCIEWNHEFMNAFMAGGSKKDSEPQSESEPAAGQPRRMNRHISKSTQSEPDDDDDDASQATPAQPDAKKPKAQPKRTAAKTLPRKKPSRHVVKPTGGSKSAAAKENAPKTKTNKEPGKKTQKKIKEKEKEEGDEKDRQDREALKVAEAKSAACKPNHPKKATANTDDESEPKDETQAEVHIALQRADTQDIMQKEQVRRAYKTRKERFYRSLKSVHLSCLLGSFALHMWSYKMLQVAASKH